MHGTRHPLLYRRKKKERRKQRPNEPEEKLVYAQKH
jgi:hypothetical protein